MRTGSVLRTAAAVAAVAGFVAAYSATGGGTATAQPPAGDVKGVRVAECNICHYVDHEGLKDYKAKFGSDKFISFDSGKLWEAGPTAAADKYKGDPHKYIFKALDPAFSPAAAKMEKLLANGNASYKLANDTRCLGCHGVDTAPMSGTKKLDQFVRDAEVGMGCTGCHGVDGDWQYKHYGVNGGKVTWRTMDPADKAKNGLVNLRDPAVKAYACASCHVGNAAEGKVVTHDMYAAGHPWLPPFELATFLQGEPLHWKTPDQLPALFESGSEQAVKTFRVRSGDDYFARHAAVGAIMSLKAEMEQLATASKNVQPGQTLDYARFDCAACHHELKIPSDRQEKGFPGRVPGRIPLKSWTDAFPGVVVDHVDPSKSAAFKAKFDAVKKAAYDKPFGDPTAMSAAAGDLMKWCDQFLATVNVDGPMVFDAGTTDALRKKIGALIPGAKADPEAFVQLLWAYNQLTPADQRKGLSGKMPAFKFDVRAGQVDWLKEFSDVEKWPDLATKFGQ